MLDFFRKLFSTDFMPHVYCLREPGLVQLHLFSDSVIALSYGLIPLALVLLIRRRRDLAFPWMFSLFGVFILGCGLTHLLGVITLWHPIYRFDGLVKAITALASFPTAVLLFRLLPQVEALPSPAQLRAEIDQRHTVEIELRDLNRELERRVAERTAQLSESEIRFRTLAEAVPNLLWTTDANGYCTYVSSRYQEFTGLSVEELTGNGWATVLHPEDQDRVHAAWSEAVQTGQPYEIEFRLRRFDGSYYWFVARGVPMRGADGHISQWLGSLTDVHGMKRTEAALRRSNEELRQFAYAAAHDLQEPLRNVSTSIGFLKRSYGEKLDGASARWFSAAVEGAQRLHEMIKDLLTYSRAVDSSEHSSDPVSVNEAVKMALVNLDEPMVTAGARIEVASLPSVRVYETHLVQIFQNLLSNAIKYRKSDLAPEIRITAVKSAAQWQFCVSDNGIGFNPEYAEKIFGVFKRLHLREEYPGNGIGLAICARVVAHYGGRIWAQSQPGQGAAFYFTFTAEEDS